MLIFEKYKTKKQLREKMIAKGMKFDINNTKLEEKVRKIYECNYNTRET